MSTKYYDPGKNDDPGKDEDDLKGADPRKAIKLDPSVTPQPSPSVSNVNSTLTLANTSPTLSASSSITSGLQSCPSINSNSNVNSNSNPISNESDRLSRLVRQGVNANIDAAKCIPELSELAKELRLAPIAYAKADKFAQEVGNKAVMCDGNQALSGINDARKGENQNAKVVASDKYVHEDTKDIRAYCQKIGHKPIELSAQKDFYVCHADKQLALHYVKQGTPMPPLGDSRMMCNDCYEFFLKHAKNIKQILVITDPVMTRVIYPDGTVIKICHTDRRVAQNNDLTSTTPETYENNWTVKPGYAIIQGPSNKTLVEYGPDCKIIHEIRSDGSSWQIFEDGRTLDRRADKSSTETYPNGTRIETRPDHSSTETRSDGTRIEKSHNPFRLVEHRPDGTRREETFTSQRVTGTSRMQQTLYTKVIEEYDSNNTLTSRTTTVDQPDGSKVTTDYNGSVTTTPPPAKDLKRTIK